MTDFWGIAAAVATSASAGFVAWQAGETRRSTKISQNALKSSQAVALDAARGRLDDQAPQVEVHLTADAAWPPLGPSSGWPQPWPATQEWHFPRDEDVHLALRVTLHVTNHSNRPVHVTFQGDLYHPYVEGADRPTKMDHRLLLDPAQSVTADLRKHFPLKDWAENHRLSTEEAGEGPAQALGLVRVHDDRDNGVIDSWELKLSGFPIRPDSDRAGVWHLTAPTLDEPALRCVDFTLQPPRVRSYWLSRSKDIPLPDPVYPSEA
ncbi:hypothetical protein EOT10_40615 [Streptomyces antnestii]|uniref:Uncharacterized protein n=1 Tax=Streptomyces antnestii TaxID=2494256 RepID=A0A3S2W662_9ACTN|nr:hypothetical protein [Streptomyces sp. San01]RVU14598.1 hypothetical protein EOT10_40615 [Streptomyces sp. San01]